MKKNNFIDIKGLDKKSLVKKANEFRKDITELILDKNLNKLSNLKQVNHKRKDLAQVLTVLRQKDLLDVLESEKPSLAKTTKIKKGDIK